MLTTVCGPEGGCAVDTETSQHGDDQAEPATGAHPWAPVAAWLMAMLFVVARFPDRAIRIAGLRGWVAALVGVVAIVNVARVIAQVPFTFAGRDSSAAKWAADQIKALGGMIVVGGALTVALYAVIRATPWWWLAGWALFATVTLVSQAAMPLILRVQTGPLSPAGPPLAGRVAVIAANAGADIGGGVLLAGGRKGTGPAGPRGHKQGPRCNAYVVGWGASRRVVLESGVAAWPPPLVDQVVAHELGHWKLGHVARRLPITLAVQLLTFALAAAVLTYQPLLDWAGVAGIGDPRSYPLVLGLTTFISLPARLVLAAYDRSQERQADRFALTLLGDPAHFAAMLDLAARDGGAPRRLSWWRYGTATHPPIGERIQACLQFGKEPTT